MTGHELSWAVRAWRWIKAFGAVPTNLARISETREADADHRPRCTSCGTGRVGNLKRESRREWIYTIGTCSNCQMFWIVSDDGAKLSRPKD